MGSSESDDVNEMSESMSQKISGETALPGVGSLGGTRDWAKDRWESLRLGFRHGDAEWLFVARSMLLGVDVDISTGFSGFRSMYVGQDRFLCKEEDALMFCRLVD